MAYPVSSQRTSGSAPDWRDDAWVNALTESRARYKGLVEMSADFCWETDSAGVFVFVSPGGALGFTADDLVEKQATSVLRSTVSENSPQPFAATQPFDGIDMWVRDAEGNAVCLEITARPIFNRSAERSGARGICRDVTRERERAETLGRLQMREHLVAHIMKTIRDESESEAMLNAAAKSLAHAVTADGCAVYDEVSASPERDGIAAVFGEADLARTILAAVNFSDRHEEALIEHQVDNRSVLLSATFWQGAVNGALAVWRDDVEDGWQDDDRRVLSDIAVQFGIALHQIDHRKELETLSRTDGLTGLLNRRAFTDELQSRLARAGGNAGALFYVDLDNFKPVNDLHGHDKGDDALLAVAEMLQAATRPGDLVARLGGDEFALWLDRTDASAAETRADELLDQSSALLPLSGGPEIPLGFSIGIAVHDPDADEDIAALTARADAAMYAVKKNGKGGAGLAPAASETGE